MREGAKRAVVTRIVCALALFMLGFANHAVARSSIGPYSVEYQLPDGSYASMCLPSAEHGTPHDDNGNHCDTCIVLALHLFAPPSDNSFRISRGFRRDTVLPERDANLKRILSHFRLSRGPPLTA